MTGTILVFPSDQARTSLGQRSGRNSERETPVSRSIGKTNSAGTPRLERSSQYQTCDCVVPILSAKGFCPPATVQARRSASFDMRETYPNLGGLQPKNLWRTANRNFGSHQGMEIDPVAFGCRVRELRKELGWSQDRLAEEAGQSQSNIGWIEKGGAKDPRKQALALAEALTTTADWLLYAKGPRRTGPRILTTEQISKLYDHLPIEAKATITAAMDKVIDRKKQA